MALDIISGIYKITNKINNKSYIGQSNNIQRRFSEHKSTIYRTHHANKVLYKAIKKYGIDNFSFDILEECTESQMDDREVYWIKYYKTYPDGYNRTMGGKGFDNDKRKLKYYIEIATGYDVMDYICCSKGIEINSFENVMFDERVEDMSVEEAYDYYDGMETMLNDFCDGYNSFEEYAECNL